MKKKSKAKPQARPETIIQNCTFTNDVKDSETTLAIARALEANAEALNALANRIGHSAPMIQIGETKDK